MSLKVVDLPPQQLKEFSSGFQSRVTTNFTVVAEYRDALKNADCEWIFPPVTAFKEQDGTQIWLVDGNHRVEAAIAEGLRTIPVSLQIGSRREALLYALGANASHGLQRTSADKRNAVMLMLSDAEWVNWANRDIARKTGTSPTFVAGIRNQMVASGKIATTTERTYTRDGRTQVMVPSTTRAPLAEDAVLAEEDEPRLRKKEDRNRCLSCNRSHSWYIPATGYKWICGYCKYISTDQQLAAGVWVEEPPTPRHWGLQAKVNDQARRARTEAEEAQAKETAKALAALATPPPDPAPVVVAQPAPQPEQEIVPNSAEYNRLMHEAIANISLALRYSTRMGERVIAKDALAYMERWVKPKLLSDNENYHE
jgi:hypothetical protein